VISALRSRAFRLLWLAQSVSGIGDALIVVAVGLYVTHLTDNPSAVGVVLVAYSAPLVLFVLIGGVVADRLPRKRLMVASDLVRATLHGLLAVLIVVGAVQIWHLVVIGALFATAEAFFRPAYTGLLPQTVAERDIQGAQALSGLSAELAMVLGPTLATTFVLMVGGALAFAVDALTFVVSAALVIRVRPRPRGEVAPNATVGRDFVEGWRAVRERGWVIGTIGCFAVVILVAIAPFLVLGATVAHDQYGSEGVFGLVNAALGVGTVTGAAICSRWRPRRPMFTGVLLGLGWPLASAVFALGPPLGVLFPVVAVAGAGIGVFAVLWESALAQRIPPHLLSRVSAWDWMGSLALLPIGYALAGPVGGWLGNRTVVLVGGGLGAIAMLAALLPSSTRSLTRLEDPPGPAPSPILAATSGP
jgi:MFS family permease